MRIRFLKILSTGRTVKFEKEEGEEPMIRLDLIVQRAPERREKSGRREKTQDP